MQIIGHKQQWEFLEKIVEVDRIPQAMLFSGPEHLGKKRAALEFIKLLNCKEQKTFRNIDISKFRREPCQECFSCKNIENGRYPDLTIVRPQNREIQIFQIRALQNILNLSPQISCFKSVIIDKAESMNSEAQNCLLKTLEEPKGKALLILVSSQSERLTETIRSRTQILKFYPLRDSEMKEYFKGKSPQDFLEKLVFLSAGLPGKAIEFLKEPEKLNLEFQKFKEIQEILDSDFPKKLSLIKGLFEEKDASEALRSFLKTLLGYLRMSLLQTIGLDPAPYGAGLERDYPVKDYSLEKLKAMIEASEDLKTLSSWSNINPKLALENLIINNF